MNAKNVENDNKKTIKYWMYIIKIKIIYSINAPVP